MKELGRPRGRKPADRRDRELAELRRRAERAEAELAKAKRVIEIQGNRLSAVGADARYRQREREHRAMIARHRRRADADHRHPAGVPGAGRLAGDDLPSPTPARAAGRARPRPTPARALSGPERQQVLDVLHSRAVRRRLAGGDVGDAAGRGHLPVLDPDDVPDPRRPPRRRAGAARPAHPPAVREARAARRAAERAVVVGRLEAARARRSGRTSTCT